MLKIWKQGWKNQDSSRRAQSEQVDDGSPDTQISGASSSGSHLDSAAAAPQSTVDAAPGPDIVPVQTEEAGARRKRTSPNVAEEHARPAKKLKTEEEDVPAQRDTLGNHLPEIFDVDKSVSTNAASFEQQVLDQVKMENTIAVLGSSSAANKVSIDFLTWAVELERRRPLHKPRPTTLFVVDDEASIDPYAAILSKDSPLTIGKYTEIIHRTGSQRWTDLLHNDVVIVSTNVLLESLLQRSLHMRNVHAFLIADADSIKNQDLHPIVRVMNEFYLATNPRARPKILVIAATPANRRYYLDSSMLKLEGIFDAKVAGISEQKRAEILALPDRPIDVVVVYSPPVRTAETHLFRLLHQLDPTEAIFRRHFRGARYALAQVGSCGSDLVWRRALRDIEASIPADFDEDDDSLPEADMALGKTKTRIRDLVKNWVFAMPNLDMGSRGFNVTPKILKLVDILEACQCYGDSFRGVVFVQRRAVAFVITDLLRSRDDRGSFLRPCALVGHDASGDHQHQEDIFRCFANGTYNLLIATKFAEDLDLPKAAIVIRFDMFESQVSHAYIRARTRGRESHLIHMVEKDNDVHRRIVSLINPDDEKMQEWTEKVFTDPRSSVPPRSLRVTTDPYTSDSEDEDDGDPSQYIKDPTTSGRIYPQDATTVIYRFAAMHPGPETPEEDGHLFEFEDFIGVSGAARKHICTVILPQGSPIERITGPPSSSGAEARRAACFQTCWDLFERGFLSYRLFPLPPSATKMDATPKTSAKKEGDGSTNPQDQKWVGARCYLRKKPDFWDNAISGLHRALYPTIIMTDAAPDSPLPYAPILMLSWKPLPPLDSIRLFFSGVPGLVHFRPAEPFEVNEDRLHDIYMYTIRLCRAIGNKPFVCSLENMPYFLAPLMSSWHDASNVSSATWELPSVADHIPWDAVKLGAEHWVVPIRTDSVQALTNDMENAVIQDRGVEFTRRYDVVRVRPDLTPLSKPEDSPREAEYENLVEYCKGRRKGFEGLKDYAQPLIEVSKVPAVLNRLNPTSRPMTESTKSPAKYLIPELCTKFTIAADTLRTALLLPSITRRMDDLLLVKELNAKFFDHAIKESHLHAAISAPSAGIEFDYERLELLGDAFLKYLSSIYVFVTNPAQHEGALHVARQKIISNKSLLQNAGGTGLPAFIQSKPFTFKLWQPPGFHIIPAPRPPRADAVIKTEEDEAALDAMQDPASAGATEGAAGEALLQDGGSNAAAPESAETQANDVMDVDSLTMAAEAEGLDDAPAAASSSQPNGEGSGSVLSTEPSSSSANSGQPADSGKPKKKPKKKKQQEDLNTQWLGDKAIADVAEAIIGAAYISGGREGALRVAKAMNIPIPHIDRWSDFGRKVLAPPPNVTAKLRPGSIEAVEGIIGHKFNRPHLLAQALTHASIHGHETTSYERLEFIGDAILDFMVIRYIYDRDTQLSPGALTLLKGAMVSNSALAAVCVWSGLQEHLLFESFSLAANMQTYADQLKLKQAEEYALAAREGRPPGQYWLEIEPPKAMSDVVESIIGAIYISDDFSPVGAESLFDKVLKPFYDKHITLKTLSHHPTKILFELFQAHGCQHFEIVKEKDDDQATRCDVVVHDVVLSSASDTTTTFAARRASLYALDALEGDSEFLIRTCDCRSHAQARKAQKKGVDKILAGFGDEDDELVAVEGSLDGGDKSQGSSEKPDIPMVE